VVTGPEDKSGINGGLVKGLRPHLPRDTERTHSCAQVGVDDYDESERRMLDAGGQVALPKMALTGVAWQGYYLDRRRLRPMPNSPFALGP
jgi:predicted enzyme related to lactoylglutathione lyase